MSCVLLLYNCKGSPIGFGEKVKVKFDSGPLGFYRVVFLTGVEDVIIGPYSPSAHVSNIWSGSCSAAEALVPPSPSSNHSDTSNLVQHLPKTVKPLQVHT